MMKKVIKRNLPLDVQYVCVDKAYIPVLDGVGTCCANCGKLIANIATVKSVNGAYDIGFDCLETFLLNNNLLKGFDAEQYENVKKWISKTLRFSKTIKEVIEKNRGYITGIAFEREKLFLGVYSFYWLTSNINTSSRNNDYVKIKDIDFDFMITTLRNIFPKLDIIIFSKKIGSEFQNIEYNPI